MYHDMLHLGETGLNGGMYGFGYFVSLRKAEVSVNPDLQVHIDPGSEHTGLQHIHTKNTVLFQNTVPELRFRGFVTAMVHHLIDGIPEDVDGHLEDEQADHKTRYWLEYGITHACAGDADEGAD